VPTRRFCWLACIAGFLLGFLFLYVSDLLQNLARRKPPGARPPAGFS
jgi:hypothetical protein